jgi:thioredoxin reductase (NADPH)
MTINSGYDVIILGAGPAGLTAGIYTARSGLKTLIIEEKFPGGLMSEAPFIENYPGLHEGITGLELSNRMELQAKKFGVQINSPEKAVELRLEGETKIVRTEKSTYNASALILSLGNIFRRLNVPGEKEFRGKGVSYCATCDGHFFKGKKVLVVGGGNSTAETAIYLSALASDVKMIHHGASLRAEDAFVKQLRNNNVNVILNTAVKEIRGEKVVKDVVLEDVKTGKYRIVETDGVFVQIGENPSSVIAQNAGVKTDEKGYFIVDDLQRTNIEGVYAAGDATNCPVKQIGTAVGQAIIAAVETFAYIRRPRQYPR